MNDSAMNVCSYEAIQLIMMKVTAKVSLASLDQTRNTRWL